jgi:hypothetical protein
MAGKLSKAKMQIVCDELAKGKSLRSICEHNDAMPAWSTVLQAVQRSEELYEMYARARAIGAEVLADEMHDLAASPLPPDLDPRLANAEVQRRRVEIDTKKWTFAKMQPRGVRHKKEDVEQANGPVMLVWGSDATDSETEQVEQRSADVVKLVTDGDEGTG